MNFEIKKNVILTLLLLFFSGTTFIYRYWDVFFKSYGGRGKIYFGWTLYLLALAHSLIGIFALLEYFFFRSSYNWLIGTIAFFVFLLGQLLRNWAVRSLGRFHSPHIEIKPGHELVKIPPYNYVRNPYYIGALIEVLSTSLILNAYLTWFFSLLTYLPIIMVRVYLEEREMRNHFRLIYDEYRSRTPRFVPSFRGRT